MRGIPKPPRPGPPKRAPIAPAEVMSPGDWFARRGWVPFPFQQEAWAAYRAGASGLIHASTGTGKTYAAFFGELLEAVEEPLAVTPPPVRVLWVTPLRALSADTALALEAPLRPLGLNWDIGTRTADTPTAARARQQKRLPTVLVTTPESLSLLLTYPDAREKFADLRCVVCDEWHELFGSKRGVLTELALARLRTFRPHLRTWGLSATLGNLDDALAALIGTTNTGRVIRGHVPKPVAIDAVLPPRVERFPWAGHLGLSLLPQVVAAVEGGKSALLFTNTRGQCEQWYQALLGAKPEWAGQVALHHGSLDRKARDWVEDGLRAGTLRCVVCTSTLDLGVDFAPVDRVLQVGSPKGVARLLQRAGRSGHRPGETSRVTCVPTHALELVEVSAARAAAAEGRIECRFSLEKPLDVLAQHCVGSALAGGFRADELLAEVRTARAYRGLARDEWAWVLDFVTRGGEALKAYPDYRRVVVRDGVYAVEDARIARRHRLSVGVITSEAAVLVRFLRGPKLGALDESFAARLKPGDRFTFAGRTLEFVKLYEMTAWVRLSKKQADTKLRWSGARLPLSGELSAAVRAKLGEGARGQFADAEMRAIRPVLEVQARWSRVPMADEVLAERLRTRDGYHLFLYPFEGRLVHEGVAALLAYRLSLRRPQTFALACNDYGFELASPDPLDLGAGALKELLAPAGLAGDVLASLNAAELAKRQFREVARVAGLVNPGLPNAGRTAKQLQASSGLFYDVFREHDPSNLLLWQARREVLDRQFEVTRLRAALDRVAASRIVVTEPPRPTPFAFPLLVERLRESVSSEALADRVRKMAAALERKAEPE
ncbi:dead deah box helicase : DEAD/H associated domain protein OS=Roseiflexus castenholzii (strain DSM 13941 / HLO8) GN=Rcas_1024 PE=4 SV=1: DEAD: Helicase_C: DEAD_assoc [Gemmata massiliana]|uniref:Helicase ATP-binding domain-containing protein n=1 Tax=Gemmata massiliana TaxID=1210884 RepID=A0A6P2DK06_9BACT|nr:ligase-associated DNA damage response DEXH box helicase [Gemmata massiliana]VTS00698.1 dead deah box helicase : DEAD/H associated domain protein OS=Roseiflexus castenholzii (strain DSM 13941 / HLO8) GN=Rcas_1024 PE=4 SV=1: DEAD: Helicase_C: DEAD_assoc [Gemmata massiliana]